MSDLAAAIARTRELYAELAEIWEDPRPSVSVHGRDHQELHESGAIVMAFEHQGGWHLSATLGDFLRGPQLFARLDDGCDACQTLCRVALQDAEARAQTAVSA